MNELPKIPWGKVISNFVWIAGAAIIMAALGYQEFLVHLRREIGGGGEKGEGKKTKSIGLSSEGFKKALFLGLTLIFGGASAAIGRPWISAVLAVFALLAAIFFVRKILADEES
jgi:hypothetical protein